MEYDIHNKTLESVALAAAAIASDTTVVGAIIDSQNFDSLEYVLQVGGFTDGTYTVLLEDGDDAALSDAAPVDAELVLGSAVLTAAGVSRIGSISKKRYQRLSVVSTGTTSGALCVGAVAIQQHARYNPTANAS